MYIMCVLIVLRYFSWTVAGVQGRSVLLPRLFSVWLVGDSIQVNSAYICENEVLDGSSVTARHEWDGLHIRKQQKREGSCS